MAGVNEVLLSRSAEIDSLSGDRASTTRVPTVDRLSSTIWGVTFSLAGVGSTFLGSLLPRLSANWHLRDGPTGLIVSALFLGSFVGTLLLSANLRRTLLAGAWCAFFGFLGFAACMFTPRGFCTGLACLFLAGLGMGQLMSSINLIVGRAHSAARAGALSNLAALWCVGAIASPLVTSVLFAAFPSPSRISLMAELFLLPLMAANIPASSSMPSAVEAPTAVRKPRRAARMGLLFTLFFFLYGGIEASITGWLPLYAIRAGAADLVAGQWTISLLWLGLAAGRLMTKFIVPRIGELRLLQLVLLLSALAFAGLLVFHSGWAFTSGCVAAGCVLGPVFPLALSMTIGQALSNRAMGVVLASCALGSSLLPSALGLLSSLSHSLQRAMLLPLSGLLVLVFMVELAKPDCSEA